MDLIYHPTTVLVLDDDPLFLESIEYSYSDRFLCHTTKSPDDAIALLRSRNDATWKSSSLIAPHVNGMEGEDHQGDRLLELRPASILDIARSESRFETISVVVVDFAMPSMTGVDFCRQVREIPAKKILLTGKTGDQTAVGAFNEGLIDVFLLKQDAAITQKLPREIERLQHSFFDQQSAPVRALAGFVDMAFVDDDAFQRRFEQLCKELAAVEYYLSAPPPRMVVVDANGRPSSIVIYDDDTMRAQQEIAEAAGAPAALLKRLHQRNAVAVFPTATGFYEPQFSNTGFKYVHPAERFGGKKPWWLAVLRDDASAMGVGQRIVSLAEYRRKRHST